MQTMTVFCWGNEFTAVNCPGYCCALLLFSHVTPLEVPRVNCRSPQLVTFLGLNFEGMTFISTYESVLDVFIGNGWKYCYNMNVQTIFVGDNHVYQNQFKKSLTE